MVCKWKKKRNKETCPGQVLYLQEICTCVFMLGKNTSICVYHICHLHYTIINILNNYFYLEFQILISLYLFITHTYICIYIYACSYVCMYVYIGLKLACIIGYKLILGVFLNHPPFYYLREDPLLNLFR